MQDTMNNQETTNDCSKSISNFKRCVVTEVEKHKKQWKVSRDKYSASSRFGQFKKMKQKSPL